MQEFVFFIDGDVKHPLTIDPTVWIFDERKVDLDTYFDEEKIETDDEEAYTKAISAQWDKEMTEGATPPTSVNRNENVIRYERQKLISGSFGMPLHYFIDNTEPIGEISHVQVSEKNGTVHTIEFERVRNAIAGFAKNGVKLEEDGPIHFYYGDGSNRNNPIKNIVRFTILKK